MCLLNWCTDPKISARRKIQGSGTLPFISPWAPIWVGSVHLFLLFTQNFLKRCLFTLGMFPYGLCSAEKVIRGSDKFVTCEMSLKGPGNPQAGMYRMFYIIFIVLFFLGPVTKGQQDLQQGSHCCSTESDINHRPVPNRQYFAAIRLRLLCMWFIV